MRVCISLVVRISHDAVTFACGRLAVDFVRKTVYLRQANLCTWLESYTVTANSLLCSTERAGNRHIYVYKDAFRERCQCKGADYLEPPTACFLSCR
jgi:hypothetical protein